MKKIFYVLVSLVIFTSCNSDERRPTDATSDSDIDAARNFIQAALVGDYHRARTFMINDSLNLGHLNAIERLNERMSPLEKERYQTASIRIHEKTKINDSTSIVQFSNSYKNKIDSLKVIRANGKWLVDFKFLFKKNDTLP